MKDSKNMVNTKEFFRNLVWFYLSDSEFVEFTKDFISDGKIHLNNILPEPTQNAGFAKTDWRLEHWGTTESDLPVIVGRCHFAFDTERGALLSLMEAIAKLNPAYNSNYKYASEFIGKDVGNFNLDCGRVMQAFNVTNPPNFACGVWGIDVLDFAYKSKGRMGYVKASEVEQVSASSDPDSDEYTELDSMLAQEDH